MIQRIALALFLALVFALCCDAIAAARPPLPAEQWTPGARLSLARCVVGESGWLNGAEHVAHMEAVRRQWETRRRGGKRLTFERQTHLYCRALQSKGRPWIRELPPTSLHHWPDAAGPNLSLWLEALRRVDDWAHGLLLSPCPGAEHWGARNLRSDLSRAALAVREGRWHVVACLEQTGNRFYRRAK